jgi:polyisoprenoid-binding protein YceI
MKTSKFLLVVVVLFTTTTMFAQKFTADVEKSSLAWLGKKVTGEHNGYIELKSGTMTLENEMITSGTFVINMTTITCEDLKSEDYNKKLVGHLKSDDFFGVESFPEATLVIKDSESFSNGEAEVTADLTIKGKTHPNTFTAKKEGNTYTASIVIDRSKYDVRYGSKSFFEDLGDNMIYDEFTLDVTLVVK